MAEPSNQRLDSWKQIASHLQRQVRTVQRWEADAGLPVHRVPHKNKGTVFAFAAELDAWWEQHRSQEHAAGPAASPPMLGAERGRIPAWAGWAAAAMLTLAAVTYWSGRAAGSKARVEVRPMGRLLVQAGSEGGRVAWLDVSGRPRALALDPSGDTLYIATADANAVVMLATSTGAVAGREPLVAAPVAMVVTPDGTTAYVGTQAPDGIVRVDLRSRKEQFHAAAGVISDLALSGDGRYLYASMLSAGLERWDTLNWSASQVGAPGCPAYLQMAPGDQLLASYQCRGPGGAEGHDELVAFHVPDTGLVAQVHGPPQVGGPLAVSPDGAQVWEDAGDACTAPYYDHRGCPAVPSYVLNVFDRRTWTPLASVRLPAPATRLRFLPDGSRLLALGDGGISVIDRARAEVVESIPVPDGADAAIARDGRVWVASSARHAVAALTPAGPACNPPKPALTAWWPGDGTANDVWGGVMGHLIGAAGFAPGRIGQAFALQPGGAVALGASSRFQGLRDFTAGMWVNPARGVAGTLMTQAGAGGGPPLWRIALDERGRPRLCVALGAGGESCVSSAAALTPGSWTYLTALQRGASLQLYQDGATAGQAAMSAAPAAATAGELLLGGGFAGLLDEVVLYEAALPQASITALARPTACRP